MTTDTPAQPPPPPPLRQVIIPPGTLVGYKACPGRTGQRLMDHTATDPGHALWSGIYVQLSLSQAVSYVPNQYDRGETTCCICKIVTKQPLKVAVFDDPAMAEPGLSSADKADWVFKAIEKSSFLEAGHHRPFAATNERNSPTTSVVSFLGNQDHALCLVDCETYELAVPHTLFSPQRLIVEPILIFPLSTVIPGGVIGDVELLMPHDRFPKPTRSELADAAILGPMLEERFEENELLQTKSDWLPPPA